MSYNCVAYKPSKLSPSNADKESLTKKQKNNNNHNASAITEKKNEGCLVSGFPRGTLSLVRYQILQYVRHSFSTTLVLNVELASSSFSLIFNSKQANTPFCLELKKRKEIGGFHRASVGQTRGVQGVDIRCGTPLFSLDTILD